MLAKGLRSGERGNPSMIRTTCAEGRTGATWHVGRPGPTTERDMKATTITRYETSDGKSFGNRRTAQEHELTIWMQEQTDATRLTATQIIDLMIEKTDDLIAKMRQVAGGDDDEE